LPFFYDAEDMVGFFGHDLPDAPFSLISG